MCSVEADFSFLFCYLFEMGLVHHVAFELILGSKWNVPTVVKGIGMKQHEAVC
jgi:hypothetical protein